MPLKPAALLLNLALSGCALAQPTTPTAPAAPTATAATAPAAAAPTDLTTHLRDLLTRETLGTFWGGVLVFKDGHCVLSWTHGLANESLQPFDESTLFDIGDISQQFVCVALLTLEKAGKLSIEDPLSKFFPDAPEAAGAIRLVNLMNHTSGLAERIEIPATIDVTDRDAVVSAILATPLPGEPGKGWLYSRRGYNVLAAVIEKASGSSFEDYLRTAVFEPAGMTSTGFSDGKGLDASRAAIRVSAGRELDVGRYPLFTSGRRSWLMLGNTGIITCLRDMTHWERVLSTDLLLTQSDRDRLVAIGRQNFALGSYVTTTARDTRKHWIGGSSVGFIALTFRYLDEDISMFVVGNETNEPDRLLNLISNDLLPPMPESFRGFICLGAGVRRPDVKEFEEPVSWTAERVDDRILLKGGSASIPVFAELSMSEGTARRLLATIKNVRRGTPDNPVKGEVVRLDPGRIGIKEGGITPLSKDAQIDFRGVIEGTRPDGSPYREYRPSLAVIDPAAKGWPLLVRMDDAASANLYEVISTAVKGPRTERK